MEKQLLIMSFAACVFLTGWFSLCLTSYLLHRERISSPWAENKTPDSAKGRLLFLKDNNDDDMKIVAGSFSALPEKNDPSEDEIIRYFHHKHNGNIQTAKDLGEKLADLITDFQIEGTFLPFPVTEEERQQLSAHARMLYLYTGETTAKKLSPDSILCQMVIASMGDSITAKFPDFYRKMEECRAYTIYKLCGSRRDGIERYMGEAYAQMIGHKEDESYITLGSELYIKAQSICSQLLSSVKYERGQGYSA